MFFSYFHLQFLEIDTEAKVCSSVNGNVLMCNTFLKLIEKKNRGRGALS